MKLLEKIEINKNLISISSDITLKSEFVLRNILLMLLETYSKKELNTKILYITTDFDNEIVNYNTKTEHIFLDDYNLEYTKISAYRELNTILNQIRTHKIIIIKDISLMSYDVLKAIYLHDLTKLTIIIGDPTVDMVDLGSYQNSLLIGSRYLVSTDEFTDTHITNKKLYKLTLKTKKDIDRFDIKPSHKIHILDKEYDYPYIKLEDVESHLNIESNAVVVPRKHIFINSMIYYNKFHSFDLRLESRSEIYLDYPLVVDKPLNYNCESSTIILPAGHKIILKNVENVNFDNIKIDETGNMLIYCDVLVYLDNTNYLYTINQVLINYSHFLSKYDPQIHTELELGFKFLYNNKAYNYNPNYSLIHPSLFKIYTSKDIKYQKPTHLLLYKEWFENESSNIIFSDTNIYKSIATTTDELTIMSSDKFIKEE